MPNSNGRIVLRDLHVSVLMRVYVLGGKAVSLTRISSEVQSRFSDKELCAAIEDMDGRLVSLAGTKISLLKDGYRHARMVLDAIALREPNFFAASTTTSCFLDYYDRCRIGAVPDLSGWQSLQLQMKWILRQNWKSG